MKCQIHGDDALAAQGESAASCCIPLLSPQPFAEAASKPPPSSSPSSTHSVSACAELLRIFVHATAAENSGCSTCCNTATADGDTGAVGHPLGPQLTRAMRKPAPLGSAMPTEEFMAELRFDKVRHRLQLSL
eukprot:CAMPEP_0172694712 /NCGR_PEP_ID=MMETSP1074-20121228/26851_1 /TAXON_ID=2916 /ORGANISM="Ceratium fusus, Strain PA161109" /LENGTH=131 /DNA_ID=CAMNT_0013515231 /DNA_START=145 /DNA_END=541 /DNA_ORIENTATION=-